jgi:solute carrier family 50 protein (sugar transporter)
METMQEASGWFGACVAIISFISPIFPYLNVIRGKLNFEDTPAIYVTTCYVNYFCWYIYGDMIFSDQIKYCYIIGSCINLILMVVYLAYEVKKYLVDTILNTLILITGTWALYRALTIILDDDRIVGKICIVTSCIVFISPIQIIYKVIKDKNYIFIPIYNSWLICLYSAAFVIYGIFITDFYVVFPNAISIIISLIQIVIYISYKKKYPVIGERDFGSTIGIETNTTEEHTKKEEEPTKLEEETDDIKVREKPVKIINKN